MQSSIAMHKCHLPILTDTKVLLILLLIKSTSMCKYITLFLVLFMLHILFLKPNLFNIKNYVKRYIFLLKKILIINNCIYFIIPAVLSWFFIFLKFLNKTKNLSFIYMYVCRIGEQVSSYFKAKMKFFHILNEIY